MREVKLVNCRVCGGENFAPFLTLGQMPAINEFPKNEKDMEGEQLFPLEAAFCNDCSHVQLTSALDPEDTFSDYIYFSSNSRTFVEHGAWLAEEMKKRLNLSENDLVVEAASNDGAILKSFKVLPARVLGIEPAKNIVKVAEAAGIPTVAEFFGAAEAEKILKEYGPAKVIIGANVLAHAFDLRDFVRGLKILLKNDGAVLIEVPYIADLLAKNEFDTIYHEHISYFSVYSLKKLFESEALEIFNIEYLPHIHGGSLLISAGHKSGPNQISSSVAEFLAKENDLGLHNFKTYEDFALRVSNIKKQIWDFLNGIKQSGKTIAAYGAAAKGNVLLQYCGIGPETLPFVADKSRHKQGKFTPGTHIPVVAPLTIFSAKPDYLVILAWNFAKEIMEDMDAYAKAGGKFAVFLPEPKIIN